VRRAANSIQYRTIHWLVDAVVKAKSLDLPLCGIILSTHLSQSKWPLWSIQHM